MKRTNLHTIALCLLMLCPIAAHATRTGTTHTIGTMAGNGTLSFSSGNKVGTTPLTTYTCSGTGAEFGVFSGQAAILLPNNRSEVITTPIADLVGLLITYSPKDKNYKNIQVSISMDGENWTVVSTENPNTYTVSGTINISNFPHDTYYVKIANTTNTAVGINSITYYRDDCNCFRYIEEE